MLLPGRVSSYKDTDVKLLPSSTTKHALWELYLQAAATDFMRTVAYSTFTQLWRQLLPHIVIVKPMSDLCWVCQRNSAAISRSENRPEEEKSSVSNCDGVVPVCVCAHVCVCGCVCVCVRNIVGFNYNTYNLHVHRLSNKQRFTCWK